MNDVCLSSDSSKYFKIVFFFKQKTAYELRISDWSSDVCSSDLLAQQRRRAAAARSDSEGQRRKARQKDAAPGLVESQSAHGGGAARSGFATVPLGARGPRQCRHVRVLRTNGHARACRERKRDRQPRRRFPQPPQRPKEQG